MQRLVLVGLFTINISMSIGSPRGNTASIFFLKTRINHCCPCLFFSVKCFKRVGVSGKLEKHFGYLPYNPAAQHFTPAPLLLASFEIYKELIHIKDKLINDNPTNSAAFTTQCKGPSCLQTAPRAGSNGSLCHRFHTPGRKLWMSYQ